jgi:3'-5' exonuclease
MNAEHLLLIDIETVPVYKTFEELTEPMQSLWAKKAGYISSEDIAPADSFCEKAGIYAEFGKIVCIGLGYFFKENNELQLKVKMIAGDNEVELLREFAEVCNSFFKLKEKYFCGHNIKEFDIPYLCRRMIINQLPLPIVLSDLQSKKPWENPIMDTMNFWKFGEYKNFVSVDLLSNVLQIPTPKDDIDGSDVAKVYWQENNLPRIVTYCGKDIVTVAQLYLRLHGCALLNEEQIHFAT